MRLAREGYPFIIAGLVLSGAAWGASRAFAPGGSWAWPVLVYVLCALTLFTIWFFRDPVHAPPTDPRLVLAPGQGRVVGIEEADEPIFIGERCRKISIFLSIFDVHVQRAPVSGIVEHRVYKPGAYAMAWRDKASDDNEQASLGISSPAGPVLVRQIAGLVARRIVTDPKKGDEVTRGARIGLIRFGSRVELFVPLEWDVTCKVGDRVRVGVTVMARQSVAAGNDVSATDVATAQDDATPHEIAPPETTS